MNQRELDANLRLTQRFVQDPNADPHLPLESASVDAALNCVSLQFLLVQRLPTGLGVPWRTACREVLALDAMLLAGLALLALAVGGVGPVLWLSCQ